MLGLSQDPLTLFLWVADLGWHVLDFQGPLPLGLLSPAVHGHELPVCKAFVGMIQQPAIRNVGSGHRVPRGMVAGVTRPPRAILSGNYAQVTAQLADVPPRAEGAWPVAGVKVQETLMPSGPDCAAQPCTAPSPP